MSFFAAVATWSVVVVGLACIWFVGRVAFSWAERAASWCGA